MIHALLLSLALQSAPQEPLNPPQEPVPGHVAEHPAQKAPEQALVPIALERVKVGGPYFGERMATNRTRTIPLLLARCEERGIVANFERAAARKPGEQKGGGAADAELYRVLEALGNALASAPDDALAKRGAALVEAIAKAQADDGYLHTATQLTKDGARWKDLAKSGELECASALIEAGVAWKRGGGGTKLLDVAAKVATRLEADVPDLGAKAVTAGPGLEAALVHLSQATNDPRWTELAKRTLAGRGKFVELVRFDQPRMPAADAARLCTGAVELARASGSTADLGAFEALWKQATAMTSLAGDMRNEGCPTCAGLELARFSHALLLLTGEARYGNPVDRVLYNLLPAASTREGDRFLHDDAIWAGTVAKTGEARDCCPSNVARAWAGMPGWVYAQKGNTLYQLQPCTVALELEIAGAAVKMAMSYEMPNAGRTEAKFTADKAATWNVKLRKPDWCVAARVQHDLKEQEHDLHDHDEGGGWIGFERKYEPTDGWRIHLLAPVRRVAGEGGSAILRGPVVYCIEGADNGGRAAGVTLAADAELVVKDEGQILGRTRVLRGRGKRTSETGEAKVATITAIPYFLRGNRGATDLVVWIPEAPTGDPAGQR